MSKKTEKTSKSTAAKAVKTIDQLSFARIIAQRLDMKISDVLSVVEAEQKLTMEYVKMGYRVIKKNYITIESRKYGAKKNWVSPLDGKTYSLPAQIRVLVRVGEGFKTFITDKKMPEKLCRFVSTSELSDTVESA